MGCRERSKGALNIPGMRPAGIYSAGTAQTLVNMKGLMVGKRVVILGSGDIGLIMARRMTLEGAKVETVCELMPYSGGLARNIEQCLNDFNIPLRLSHTIVKIHGKDRVSGELGMRGADGARIAAQVVSGIGFLGAGMIFVHKNTITGLTTAAGVWATAGVGLAIGAGMYFTGICAAFIIVLIQILLHKNFWWLKTVKQKKLTIKEVNIPEFQENAAEVLRKMGINIVDVSMEKSREGCTYVFIIDMPNSVSEESVLYSFDFSGKIGSV